MEKNCVRRECFLFASGWNQNIAVTGASVMPVQLAETIDIIRSMTEQSQQSLSMRPELLPTGLFDQ
jgi:hypothetical protein